MKGWLPAIFVLLAGCNNLGSVEGPAAPGLSFERDDAADQLIVKGADRGADWQRLSLRLDDCGPDEAEGPIRVHVGSRDKPLNTPATADGPTLNEPKDEGMCAPGLDLRLSLSTRPVHVGDYLAFCVTGSGELGAHDVQLKFIDREANAIVATAFFAESVARC